MGTQVPYSKRAPAGGGYRIAMYTGNMVAGLAAAAPIFTIRWASASSRMIIQAVYLDFFTQTAFTTAQGIGNSLYFARTYTVASTGGTAVTTTQTNDQALDGKQIGVGGNAQSLIFAGSGDMRIAGTVALTAGTYTLDDQPLYSWIGTTSTIGTSSNNPDVLFGYQDATNPLTLRYNDGIVITNDFVLGAVGVVVWNIGIEWTEVGNNYT